MVFGGSVLSFLLLAAFLLPRTIASPSSVPGVVQDGPGVGQGGAGDAGGQDLHVPVGKLESTLEMIAKDLKMLLCQDAPHEPDA